MANLNTLVPGLVPWAKWILAVGRYYDGRLVVTSAKRDRGKQEELYSRWQRGLSKIPAARPGTSLHEIGVAFDLARIGVDPLQDDLLMWLGEVWEYYGGKHGGQRDPVHFQIKV